ncbi:alpha/beta hydrolase [Phytoactinopolyspora alkaliphila]|uniref:Alpha/beta hydrolase n=1 Tax=Phytoactinopolyspora alkaliphila TaxID=1783498 RepID=A0A6N9YTJ8_9ACTN|nr:alpha/beta hydrolase [Phytoactinopolyspora alkaliphila]NED98302.1 alpha/beta hydrolase [Phytoactinopolyspora alkaliphila]
MRWQRGSLGTVDGVTLATRDSGGDGPAVVLLSGLGAPQSVWDRVARLLTGRYRVITFDYRGHGRSGTAEDYGFERFLDDVRVVVKSCGVRAPLLCGWSLGADLAVWHAALYPTSCSGVLVLDGAVPADLGSPGEAPAEGRDGLVARAADALARLLRVGVRLDRGALAGLVNEVQQRRTAIADAYPRLRCPVHVAVATSPSGGYDDAGLARWRDGVHKLQAAHPDVPLTWLDSDHAVPLRVPERVVELIDSVAAAAGRDHGG